MNEYGLPIPGWMIGQATNDGSIIKKNQWGLVECNDPTFIWDEKPVPDPAGGFSDEELDKKDAAFWDASSAWMDKAAKFGDAIQGRPADGWKLYESAKMAGYNPLVDGALEYWLFDFLGKWLVNNPEPTHRNRLYRRTVGDREPQ